MSRLRIVALCYHLELPEEVMEKYEYVREDVFERAKKEQGIRIATSGDKLKPLTLILTCHHRYLTDQDAEYVIRLINHSEEYKFPC